MTYQLSSHTRHEQSEHTLPRSIARRRWRRYSDRTFYLFVSPWLLGFLLLTLAPMLYALLLSFTNFDGISTHWRWIGLANYVELFHDTDMWFSLGRTLLYTAISVPLSVAGGLGLALLLNQRLQGSSLFRTIFYLPSVVPVVASAVMWKLIFDRNAGVLNAVIELFKGPTIGWLVDPIAFYPLIILVLWGLGGGMVIILAGLQGIPQELMESAAVDGANPWQSFFRIKLPLLSPVLFFQVVTGVIYAFQTLVQPLLLTETVAQSGGGSGAASLVPRSNFLYLVNVYQQFLANQRYGYGSAMLWLFFLLVLGITLLIFRSSSFWVYNEIEHEAKS